MSLGSFFEKEKEEVSLLIDIGNGSVTGSLVLFKKSSLPTFLYTTKTEFTVLEKPEVSKMFEGLEVLLNQILKKIIHDGFAISYWKNRKKKLSHVMISFSSPWFMSKTKHLTLTREIPFIVSKNFLEDVVRKEEKAFKRELPLEDGLDKDSFEVLEKSIVNTKLNGYMLDESLGKKTTSFDAYIFLSGVKEELLRKVSNVILKYTHIPNEKIIFHTFPLVSFSVLRDIYAKTSDFLMVDVTGEVTDLTLVLNDTIFGTATMESGKNFIIRKIAKEFNVPREIALSTLHLYISKKINTADILRMQNILENIEKEWAIYFENALLSLSPEMSLPSRVYLTADKDVREIYQDFLKLSKLDTTSGFRKNMDLVEVAGDTLKSLYKNDSITEVDEFIVLLVLFHNKVMHY